MADKPKKPKDNRSATEIQADLAAARSRMSSNVEGLVTEVHPKAVKQRAVDDAKDLLNREVENAKYQVKDENGWRTDRLTVAGAVAGAVTAFVVVVRLVRRALRKKKNR